MSGSKPLNLEMRPELHKPLAHQAVVIARNVFDAAPASLAALLKGRHQAAIAVYQEKK